MIEVKVSRKKTAKTARVTKKRRKPRRYSMCLHGILPQHAKTTIASR
jgi:hypothetical protein